ncbi:anti-sigma factor [Altererythrobacter aquiaggeris]|uniref:anti-sigma factor n=1 Tax=Aestuarierythrobacter aquiaggeris TaxID=1898396 RepID=UPI00301AC716
MNDRSRLAAEQALGLLVAEEAMEARRLLASDQSFADQVALWEMRLAPLLDEISELEPGPDLWPRIESAMAKPRESAEIVALRKRVRTWQLASSLAAAAAIAIALFAFPVTAPTPSASSGVEAPLVASIAIGDTPLRLGVTFLPDQSQLLISASGLTADGVHDHELWVVDDEGGTRSLGVVEAGFERRITVEPALAKTLADGSGLVLTREPLGGAPSSGNAGPVVASGTLQKI